MGLHPEGWIPVGIVLEDIQAPVLMCKCGGDANGPQHKRSLLHLRWEWLHAPVKSL